MITLKHLKIYELYAGDGDGFTRCATLEQKSIMDYKHWSMIDNFIQDLLLVKKGLASDIYMHNIDKKLQECCDNEETITKLKSLVIK